MTKESMEFKTEVKELMDLMIHSLYSHKEIFLRELISNASDAIDKLRYESLTSKELLEGQNEFRIKLIPDKEAGTLTISDNGMGMGRDEAVSELGTIAHSGTKEFLSALKSQEVKDNPELIGQFGVGFYSAFMVADSVTVTSRRAGTSEGVRWESTADGKFSVEETEKEAHGTEVILTLKEDAKEYLDEWRIKEIVRQYSDYIEHPVVMDVEREEDSTVKEGEKVKVIKEETLNSQKAIWLKRPSDVKEEEYKEFYKHISRDFGDPAETLHYRAEGSTEFSALVFIPSHAPMDIFYKDFKIGPMLYVKRVLIMHNCEELVPPYLRFLRGVVDSSDLPLNVSREILQNNRMVEVIKKNIIKKTLDALQKMKTNSYDKYVEFFGSLGKVLKEGIHFDFERKEEIASLTLMESTATEAGKFTTFDEYIDRMKPDQEEIYYITGPSRLVAEKSPYLESLRDKGLEVLLMTDEVDDIIFASLIEYKGKKLRNVLKGEVDLGTEENKEEDEKKYSGLLGLIKEELKDKVSDVRLSGRLKDSPCCLVAAEGGMDHNLEALLKSMGQEVPASKKALEINPTHPLFESMQKRFDSEPASALLKEYTGLLYDQAMLMMGASPEDPAEFARTLTKLMQENIKDA
ncbi:molecular chaperone HtpG [Nitrospirota bacterium]